MKIDITANCITLQLLYFILILKPRLDCTLTYLLPTFFFLNLRLSMPLYDFYFHCISQTKYDKYILILSSQTSSYKFDKKCKQSNIQLHLIGLDQIKMVYTYFQWFCLHKFTQNREFSVICSLFFIPVLLLFVLDIHFILSVVVDFIWFLVWSLSWNIAVCFTVSIIILQLLDLILFDQFNAFADVLPICINVKFERI